MGTGTGTSMLTAGCLVALALVAASPSVSLAADQPLADAAQRGDWSVVRTLIQDGADVTARQGDGATALHWAAYWDEVESADLLIDAGADVNAANDLGVTPLWAAVENGSAAMVRRLLAAGADPHAPLLSGETPLMTAARVGAADVARQLLEAGADTAATAGRGQTALMWAVAQGHPASRRGAALTRRGGRCTFGRLDRGGEDDAGAMESGVRRGDPAGGLHTAALRGARGRSCFGQATRRRGRRCE